MRCRPPASDPNGQPRWGAANPKPATGRRRSKTAPATLPIPAAPAAEPGTTQPGGTLETLDPVVMAYGATIANSPGARPGDWVSLQRIRGRLAWGGDRDYQNRLLIEAHTKGTAVLRPATSEERLTDEQEAAGLIADGRKMHLLAVNPASIPGQTSTADLLDQLRYPQGHNPHHLLTGVPDDSQQLREIASAYGIDPDENPEMLRPRIIKAVVADRDKAIAAMFGAQLADPDLSRADADALIDTLDHHTARAAAASLGLQPGDHHPRELRSMIREELSRRRAAAAARLLENPDTTADQAQAAIDKLSYGELAQTARHLDGDPYQPMDELKQQLMSLAHTPGTEHRGNVAGRTSQEVDDYLPHAGPAKDTLTEASKAFADIDWDHRPVPEPGSPMAHTLSKRTDPARRPGDDRTLDEANGGNSASQTPAQREEADAQRALDAIDAEIAETRARRGRAFPQQESRRVDAAKRLMRAVDTAPPSMASELEGLDNEDLWFRYKLAESRASAYPAVDDTSEPAVTARARLAEIRTVVDSRGLDPDKGPERAPVVEIDDETRRITQTAAQEAIRRQNRAGRTDTAAAIESLSADVDRGRITAAEFVQRLEDIERGSTR